MMCEKSAGPQDTTIIYFGYRVLEHAPRQEGDVTMEVFVRGRTRPSELDAFQM